MFLVQTNIETKTRIFMAKQNTRRAKRDIEENDDQGNQ